MTELKMKYFVLNPRAKHRDDAYANASHAAMFAYADAIEDENPELAKEIRVWARREVTRGRNQGDASDRTWTEEEIRKAVGAFFLNYDGERASCLLKSAQDCMMRALRDD